MLTIGTSLTRRRVDISLRRRLHRYLVSKYKINSEPAPRILMIEWISKLNSLACELIDKRAYSSYANNWDDRLLRSLLLSSAQKSHVWLEYGAGRGALPLLNFRGKVSRIAGTDIDEAVLGNTQLDEARLIDRTTFRIDYPENYFDVVFSDNVLEHLPDPGFSFEEIYRVLKPGGKFISKTPNTFHYVPTIARLTPHWFHEFVNRCRGRDAKDTFPTFYRANSTRKIRSLAKSAGFKITFVKCVEGRPEYLRLNVLMYLLEYGYERLVNLSSIFSNFRGVILFELNKPPT